MRNTRHVLTALSLLMTGSIVYAIPPKLDPTPIIQPDGSTVTIKVVGNRDLHFTVDEEGTLLTRDQDGFFKLARVNENGEVVSTGIKATESNSPAAVKLNNELVKKVKKARTVPTRAEQSGLGMYKKGYPTKGSPKVPVILVEFQDVKFSDNYDAKEYFTNLITGENFTDQGAPGSIKKYFEDQSQGVFVPQFDVYGPVTLSKNMAYYGSNNGIQDALSHYMVSESLKILNPDVDFSQYDADQDKDIDFVYIIYAGYGENRGAGEDTIWPHAGYIKGDGDYVTVDGVWGNNYACSNELVFGTDEPEGMGAFVHEYSHIIGLPDIYPTSPEILMFEGWDYTAGQYTILDYGPYNNDGKTPPNYTAYERNALKWGEEPIMLEKTAKMELEDISTGRFALIPTEDKNEFFLIENRQQTGWDEHIPNHGMLVWHIDYNRQKFQNNQVNNDKNHQHVRLVKANNEMLFGHPRDNQLGYPFPGTTGATEFTSETTPALLAWDGSILAVEIKNITEDSESGLVTFDVVSTNPDADDPAKVDTLETELNKGSDIFNLQGMKVSPDRLTKGIYIINGRKTVIR